MREDLNLNKIFVIICHCYKWNFLWCYTSLTLFWFVFHFFPFWNWESHNFFTLLDFLGISWRKSSLFFYFAKIETKVGRFIFCFWCCVQGFDDVTTSDCTTKHFSFQSLPWFHEPLPPLPVDKCLWYICLWNIYLQSHLLARQMLAVSFACKTNACSPICLQCKCLQVHLFADTNACFLVGYLLVR